MIWVQQELDVRPTAAAYESAAGSYEYSLVAFSLSASSPNTMLDLGNQSLSQSRSSISALPATVIVESSCMLWRAISPREYGTRQET